MNLLGASYVAGMVPRNSHTLTLIFKIALQGRCRYVLYVLEVSNSGSTQLVRGRAKIPTRMSPAAKPVFCWRISIIAQNTNWTRVNPLNHQGQPWLCSVGFIYEGADDFCKISIIIR